MSQQQRDYKDYAANERNYLAWIRTASTVITLGFLMEKFELFLATLHLKWLKQGNGAVPIDGIAKGSSVGIALVLFGIGIVFIGFYRFVRVKRALDSGDEYMFRGITIPLIVAVIMLGFGIYLLVYLAELL